MENGKQPITPQMYTRVADGINGYAPLKDGQKTGYEIKFGGLTKREYFAAKALQGLMVQSIPGSHNSNADNWNKERAKFAVDMADALLEALEEKKEA